MKTFRIYFPIFLLLSFLISCESSNQTSPLSLLLLQPDTSLGDEEEFTEPDCVFIYTDIGKKDTQSMRIFGNSLGDIFVAGETSENLGKKNPKKYQTPFIQKFSSSDPCRKWVQMITDPTGAGGQFIGATANENGEVYVAGFSNGNVGGVSCPAINCTYLSKLDGDGNFVWTKILFTNGLSFLTGLSLDYSGNIYVLGTTNIPVNGQNPTGSSDTFFIKYDPNGNVISTILLGATGKYTYSEEITSDPNGNIYILGKSNGTFGDQTPAPMGTTIYTAKYDTNLSLEWIKYYGIAGGNQDYKISTDSNGNIYVSGNNGTIGYIDGILAPGIDNVYVVKLNNSGTKQWTKVLGVSSSTTKLGDLIFGPNNQLYIYGTTTGNLDSVTAPGFINTFLTIYAADGTKISTAISGIGNPSTYYYGRSVFYSPNDQWYYLRDEQNPENLTIKGKIYNTP